MLEIKKAVVEVVFIFLKHKGLCRQVINSSQLCSQSIPCTNFHAHVTPFACLVVTVHKQFEKAWNIKLKNQVSSFCELKTTEETIL